MNQVVKLLNTLGWLADISLVQLKHFFLAFHYSNAMFSFVIYLVMLVLRLI